MGWPMHGRRTKVTFGGGQTAEALETRGYIRLFGHIREVTVLALTDGTSLQKNNDISGYIGMSLLKGSRIDFGRSEFKISALEG